MLKSINKVIKVLIASDCILNSAWGFLAPVFAIFIVEKITLGDIAEGARVVGFATLIYWITKSFIQIPVGKFLDRNYGEKDTFWFTFLGRFIMAFTPFGYLFSTMIWHIYFWQIIYAFGSAMVVPSFYSIFTKFIDKGQEAFEWGLDSTTLGFGIGITGALGGILYSFFGPQIIFILVGVVNIISALLLFLIKKEIYQKK